jgi:hypothetical protein
VFVVLTCACSTVAGTRSETPRPSAPASASTPQGAASAADATPVATEDDPDYDVSPGCDETRTVVDDRFATPWGSTPLDVLKIALGRHRTSLAWQTESAFSYGVEGTTTTLEVEITRAGPATFLEGKKGRHRERHIRGHLECGSALLIPVHVRAETEDGVIITEGEANLTTTSQHDIGTALEQPFATHRGTLRLDTIDIRQKGLVLDGFWIVLGFSREGTVVGAIRGNYVIEGVGARWAEYACFPARSPPELSRSGESDIGCKP